MEEDMIGAAETNSIAYLNKKRKIRAELLELPLSKHVCWGPKLEYDSSSDSSTEQKKARSSIFARGESIPENANDSCSFHSNPDSVMSSYLLYPDGNSSEIGLCSLESRSLTKASSIKSESISIREELDRLYHDYEDHLLEFGNHDDKDLGELLYLNGVAPSNYVRSLGRWSTNKDTQEGSRKLTIDKEFEEYFSMLML